MMVQTACDAHGTRAGSVHRAIPGGTHRMSRDIFPSTYQSWIGRKLAEGPDARAELNRHIMDVYARPLEIYFRGHTDRWLGEPKEVVAGFFADRLAREDFLDDWHRSGLRLRRWLMNAFSFYLAELRRSRRRSRTAGAIPDDHAGPSGNPYAAIDQAFAESITHEALDIAQQQCAEQGLEPHWGVFLRHYYYGQTYDRAGADFGVTAARAAVMSRTAARRFRSALRELLGRDGVNPEELDDEIRSLLEVMGS